MRRIVTTFVALICIGSVSAQYYKDAKNRDMLHITQPHNLYRSEFDIPSIDGFTGYKADLHTHTIFSDGHLSMEARIREAWANGLDVMAVTEHLEYRPHEKNLVKYLKGYTKGAEAKNYSFASRNRPASASEINVDFNHPVTVAREAAKMYNLAIIPGIEITRREGEYSHFNALFTIDNNAIYAPETIESIRNAKRQGALVMHNHPGWTHKDMKLTPFEKEVYKAGLLDGIEVMNGEEFYPQAIERAQRYNLFISSNTDIHYPVNEQYERYGKQRNMTFIFAKDKSLPSLREAIENRRTIAYSFGTLAGEKGLIEKFVKASLKIEFIGTNKNGRPTYMITNNSSVDYLFHSFERNQTLLKGHSTVIINLTPENDKLSLIFDNVWVGMDEHLTIELQQPKQ